MIVIPYPTNFSKVYVIETASAFTDDRKGAKSVAANGVLVYSVDTDIKTGSFPVKAITRNAAVAAEGTKQARGAAIMESLYTAPFLVEMIRVR